ncbi:PKD domain-containing protein [Nocardioides sp.]|uniref:PKD domain-containing protein n=1 Tax=Nocardioides sp. TaxID=35761 RepID=UPI0027230A34|nr:PKD domain-containing protein [Nocardioides sp.]MDO9456816.1 immune inhibitor A [Nocardioides sp.]
MPVRPSRRARSVAVTAAALLGLVVAPLAVAPASGAAVPTGSATASLTRLALPAAAQAPTAAPRLAPGALAVRFDAQDRTVRRGQAFVASGTVRLASAAAGDAGTASRFRLALTDPTGAVLATQRVTTDAAGAFRTAVPAAATGALGRGTALTLGLRALDAEALTGGAAPTADAGAGAVPVAARAGGLDVANSFVSSVGWVKPGESYPSSIRVTNPGATPVVGAVVTVTAPTGSTFLSASPSAGTRSLAPAQVTWTIPTVPAANATTGAPGTATLVLESRAALASALPTIVWRDLSTTAVLAAGGQSSTAVAHGPKVIPPSEVYDTARYGDRPFPIIPVQYTDRDYLPTHSGEDLAEKINSPAVAGSTFNLYQEMSIGQLFPNGTVPSAGIATKDFTYAPGFDFAHLQVPPNTCTGATLADLPVDVTGTPLYPERITNGVYNLPGQTQFYGADSNGSAVLGSLVGVGALQNIDSGCGPTGKLVRDAAALADPEIDYSDYDTDKDGVVDFFMVVYAGCGGNGASQLGACTSAQSDLLPYDNIWPHSSSLEGAYTDAVTGLPGFTTDDQLKDLEGHPLWYTDTSYSAKTTTDTGDALKVFVRVGPYNVNPETAIDKASVISHEYGHSLGLPDFYSTGSRETYGDWNLMATDKSQNMDAFSRQELGWVVPQVLKPGATRTVTGWKSSKLDIGAIAWQRPDGTPYTLTNGADGIVHNSEMYVAKLPGRTLLDDSAFDAGGTNGVAASKSHLWWSGSGNDFGCAPTGGHNFDLSVPALRTLPAGTPVELRFKSRWDIEWDFDYGYVLTTTNGGSTYTSNPSTEGYTTSNTDLLAGNPNQVGCQATYDNGITGTSGSYDAGTEAVDRKLGNTPAPVFLPDSYDISELAGAANGALRLSYSTDPGAARPGWFIDDLEVVANPGAAGEKVLWTSDFESTGGPSDPAVFNGGCREDLTVASSCTQGWKYLQAGAASVQDHAYYLEMRDRSGFDFDGHGEIDRDPIGFQAGLYLSYTDEAHGYGNAGTDDPPAQSPLDSVPTVGSATPDLDDAAYNATTARSTFTDAKATPHVDNYSDPSTTSGNWEFAYDCLGFKVDSMSGDDAAPASNLTGDVTFTTGTGCGTFNYGYEPEPVVPNTAPTAAAGATPTVAPTGQQVAFSAVGSTDAETPGTLDFSWDFDGDGTKDAATATASHAYTAAGTYTATVTVTDPQGLSDTASTVVTVTGGGGGGDTTRPTIRTTVSPTPVVVKRGAVLSAVGSSDDVTAAGNLRYTWDRRNGGSTVDATGPMLRLFYKNPGVRRIGLTVTDEAGNVARRTVTVRVYRYAGCGTGQVRKVGDFTVRRARAATGGSYCAATRTTRGRDALGITFRGTQVQVVRGLARKGGTAVVYLDGKRLRTISFKGRGPLTFGHRVVIGGITPGKHRLEVRRVRGQAYVEGFLFS